MKVPTGNEEVIWVQPKLVCTVKYLIKIESGSFRKPVFRGLRPDKYQEECKED